MRHRTIRRNLLSLARPPSCADTTRTRSREYRGRCASLPRSDPLRVPLVSPPRGTSVPPRLTIPGGCPAIVTLALLIACPTKVYHHRHPSCPPSALNPLVSRCTYCSVFLSLRRRSPFPSATYHSSRARLHPPFSLSLSFSLFTFAAPLFITTRTHTRSRTF